MKKILRGLLLAVCTACCMTAQSADWQPDPDDPRQMAAAREIQRMLEKRPELQRYFDEAYGFAIFPNVGRIAAGFGFIYGSGLVVEQGVAVGAVRQIQGAIGFDFGVQWHSQIIFFRDAAVLSELKDFGLEFQGRGSVVFINLGAAVDPAYKPPVAIFSRTRGGLMIELAAHAALYMYRPLPGALPAYAE